MKGVWSHGSLSLQFGHLKLYAIIIHVNTAVCRRGGVDYPEFEINLLI